MVFGLAQKPMIPPILTRSLLMLAAILSAAQTIADENDLQDVEPVSVISQTEFRFPGSMRVIGVKEGHVSLVIAVDSQGSITDTFVLQSSRRAFTQSALKSVAAWRFAPARLHGQAIQSSLQIDLQFQIDQKLTWQIQSPRAANQARVETSATPILTTSFKTLDRIPLPLQITEPQQPSAGQATIEFYIDESGAVRCPRPIASSTVTFGELMLETVKKWKFEPPTLSGTQTNTMVRQVFRFEDGKLTAADPD